MLRVVPAILVLVLANACSLAPPGVRPETWATEVNDSGLHNFYMVSPGVYRSEQPDRKAFSQIEAVGIKSVLNLRTSQTDSGEVESTDLALYLVKMDAGNVSETEIYESLKVIRDAEGPILIHCWHGSDRTGAVVGAFRMVFQNWSKEEAIDELKNGGYGYHKFLYPNLVDLLEGLDVAQMRSRLGL